MVGFMVGWSSSLLLGQHVMARDWISAVADGLLAFEEGVAIMMNFMFGIYKCPSLGG